MCEVNETLANGLVELDSVGFLDELADNLTLIVLDNEDFFGAHHLLDHDDTEVRKDLVVLVLAQRVVVEQSRVGGAAGLETTAKKRVHVGQGQCLHLLIELLDKLEPVVEGDLEDFAVLNLRNPDQVVVTVGEEVAVRQVLDKRQVHTEEVAKEQRQVLDEFLIAGVTGRICRLQVHAERNDVGDGRKDLGEHLDKGLAIVGLLTRRTSYLQTTDLGQALEGNVTELGNLQETRPKGFDKGGLEDIA